MLKQKVTFRRPNGDFDRGAVLNSDSVEGYLKYMDIDYFYEGKTMFKDNTVFYAGELFATAYIEDYFPGEDTVGYYWYFTDPDSGQWRAEKEV